jgi:hypothetical protein
MEIAKSTNSFRNKIKCMPDGLFLNTVTPLLKTALAIDGQWFISTIQTRRGYFA